MKKNFMWNMFGATIYSFISFFLVIIITRINGIEDAGIFTLTFSIACVLYVVGIYYGRAYQVTDNEYSNSIFINNRIFTCILMLLISIIIAIICRFSLYKSLVLVLLTSYKLLEAFAESLYAIIQKNNQLHLVGKSMTLKTISSVIIFLIVDYLTHNLIISIVSILCINIIILVFFDLKKVNLTKLEKFDCEKNKQLLKLGFNTFAFTLLSIFVVNTSKYGMSVKSDELQGIFGIIIMPATVMSLFTQFIIHPYLNELNNCIIDRRYDRFKSIVFKMLAIVSLVIILTILLLAIIGIPILEIIYGISLIKYYNAFIFIMIGSFFYGVSTLISYILITIRKTFSQLIILLMTSIFSIVITYILICNYSIGGASIAYLLTMLFEFVFYIAILIFNLKKL